MKEKQNSKDGNLNTALGTGSVQAADESTKEELGIPWTKPIISKITCYPVGNKSECEHLQRAANEWHDLTEKVEALEMENERLRELLKHATGFMDCIYPW